MLIYCIESNSVSAQSIARTLIPKVSELRKNLRMGNLLLLMEKTVDEVNKIMFYNSIIEISIWLLGLLCFFSFPSGMMLIWLHAVHVPRGLFGLFIVIKKTPKTYDLIDSISDFDEEQMQEQWNFEKMSYHVRDNFKRHLMKILNDAKPYVLIYFVLSVICSVLDMVGLLIQVVLFGTADDIYEPLFMIAVISVLIYTN